MVKDKKMKKHFRMKNKKLCKKYPWLIPRNDFTGKICWDYPYEYTELDDIPKGWEKAFGEIWCEEIDKAARLDGIRDSLRIAQLKEKFGNFRQYFYNYSENLNRTINDFEIISEHVCISCGELHAHLINDYGWYLPLCEKCYNRRTPNPISYSKRLEEACIPPDEKIPTSYTVRHWKDNDIQEVTYDMTDLVQKIIYKNRKRKHED